MPSYQIEYEHNGELAFAIIPAANLADAQARCESLKATGELDDSRADSAELELAGRLYERQERPKRPCHQCSGHEHQRHECERCNGAGMVEVCSA